VARVRLEAASQPRLAAFFAPSAVLVPVPGSCPRTDGDIWIAELLTAELVRAGLGCLMLQVLKRVYAVRKSASAAPGSRTSVTKHFESFAIEPRVRDGDTDVKDMLLVDDVVTKGRTLLAAASRLREAHPTARIRAFAMLRTLGFAAELQGLLQPCIGEIRWARGDARRNP
jgi:predicted amidophosphoribosyltransferase